MNKKREFKKKLENFIKDESGNISRDKVLKIGLGTISALGVLSSFAPTASASPTPVSHENSVQQTAQICCHNSHASHGSHGSHGSY